RHEVPLHIEMSARHGKTARGPHCDVTIRDTGLPLAQRYPATAEGPVPADLDLAVCRRIIERHGGTVAVTPLADGAAYLVRLPCVQRPGPTTEAPPPAEPPPE